MKSMKRFLCVFLAVVLSCMPVLAEEEDNGLLDAYNWEIQSNAIAGWPQGPAIQCERGIVMDMDTDAVLYEKGIYERMFPASTTKLMTSLLVLEHGNLDEVVTFTESIYNIPEDSSSLYMSAGEQLTLRQCLYGIMLASANDICVGVAEYIGGSYDHFIEMMNDKAKQLGCVDTHFVNPHGYHDDNHYTCAYDLALIAQAAYKYPDFKEITKAREATYPATNLSEEKSFANHQKLLQDGDFYYDKCTGGKTGFTDAAWCTLVSYAESEGERLVSVVLRAPESAITFVDSKTILEYGFNNFKHETIQNSLSEADLKQLFQSGKGEELSEKQTISTEGETLVTVPTTVSVQSLTPSVFSGRYGDSLYYSYEGQKLGHTPLKIEEAVVEIPETELETEPLIAVSEAKDKDDKTEKEEKDEAKAEHTPAIQNVGKAIMFIGSALGGFFSSINLVKILILLVLLAILVVIIVLAVKRHNGKVKKQKEREREALERLKKEEEIDNMSLKDIERELRAALEEEDK